MARKEHRLITKIVFFAVGVLLLLMTLYCTTTSVTRLITPIEHMSIAESVVTVTIILGGFWFSENLLNMIFGLRKKATSLVPWILRAVATLVLLSSLYRLTTGHHSGTIIAQVVATIIVILGLVSLARSCELKTSEVLNLNAWGTVWVGYQLNPYTGQHKLEL